ncbi:MAG: phosphatidate cytidylyltransferase [Rikenellaceae bacterium]
MKIDKNFITRSISGLLLVAVLLSGILLSDISRFIVLTIIGVGGAYELLSILEVESEKPPLKLFISTLAVATAIMIYIETETLLIISILSVAFILRFILQTFLKVSEPLKFLGYEIFSLVYAFLPMMLLFTLDGKLIIALLFLVWSNDVGAYVVGVTFGKSKLCERLSPKKSWEGYFGGIVCSMIIAIFIARYFGQSPFLWTIIALFTANAAVIGDLFESMIKRSLGVKDSGNVIPGHGGMLDRFDALYFATPIFYALYALLIN